MTERPDTTGTLSEDALAQFADVTRGRRRKWADAGHLRLADKRNDYGELDVLELVVFAALVRALDFEPATLAWRTIREELRQVALGEAFLVLYDQRLRFGRLLTQPTDIARLAVNGHSFRAFDLSQDVVEARKAYREMARALRENTRHRTRGESRRKNVS